MSTIELKAELIKIIENIEDNKVLSALYILLKQKQIKTNEKDFWDELPEHVKNGINEALAESERGEGIPHDQVMKQIREKYQRI